MKTPKGFKRVTSSDTVTFTSDDIIIEVHYDPNSDGDTISGSTKYNSAQGWRTYDRYGVEDSFYLGKYGEPINEVDRVLNEEIQRAKKGIEESKSLIGVPQIPFMITEKSRVTYSEKLKSGKCISFTPSGFGIGYTLSVKRRSRWSTKGSKELAKFFGVSSLYIEENDCD